MIRPVSLEPGIEAFATRTPTLPPATHTNSYALGERDVLLVEPATPYEDERREWLAWAEGLRSQGRNLTGIFLTHHHADHAGGAEFFAPELKLPLLAHAATAERLPDLHVDRFVTDGEVLVLDGPRPQSWTVLLTPGHAPGHVCLHEPSLGAVIVGDMVATVGTILVDTRDGDMAIYLQQLARLRDLESRVALPAHGAPIPEPAALYDFYIQHRLAREAKVLAALRTFAEGGTISDVTSKAYADTPQANPFAASLSTAAHLVKLEREGLASFDGQRYSTVGAT